MNDHADSYSTNAGSPRGRVEFASHSVASLLRANGIDAASAAFMHGAEEVLRHRGRSVYARELRDADGSTQRVFVKLNWGRRRLWPRMTDLKTGQMFQSLPVREWRGIERFRTIGLNVPERLALFREGRFAFRDAVVVREVPPELSVDEMLQNGRWWDLSREQQTDLLRAIVSTLRTIHAAGLGWRGSSSRHFYPRLQTDGSWKLWLIDCEGVHRAWSRRIVDRDSHKLWRAMRESGADTRTLDELKSLLDSKTVEATRDDQRHAA